MACAVVAPAALTEGPGLSPVPVAPLGPVPQSPVGTAPVGQRWEGGVPLGMGSRAPCRGYWNVPEMPLWMSTGWSLSLGGTSHLRCPHPGTRTVEASIVLGPLRSLLRPFQSLVQRPLCARGGERCSQNVFGLSRELLSGPTAAGLLQALSEPLTADVGEWRP